MSIMQSSGKDCMHARNTNWLYRAFSTSTMWPNREKILTITIIMVVLTTTTTTKGSIVMQWVVFPPHSYKVSGSIHVLLMVVEFSGFLSPPKNLGAMAT